jgi:hypothetical protein
MHFITPLGHRGPVLRPRCIWPRRARAQTFYYPVIWYNNKIINLYFNLLNAELNPTCHLLALLGAHPILHVSRIRVNVEERSVPQFFPFVQVKHLTKEAKAKLKGP